MILKIPVTITVEDFVNLEVDADAEEEIDYENAFLQALDILCDKVDIIKNRGESVSYGVDLSLSYLTPIENNVDGKLERQTEED